MGEVISESLGGSRGIPHLSLSQGQLLVKARNCSLNFLKYRPPWVSEGPSGSAHLLSHAGPGSEPIAVQVAGAPEVTEWAVAPLLRNLRPLSTRTHTQYDIPAVTRERDRAFSPLPWVTMPYHNTLHIVGSREMKEKVSDSQDAIIKLQLLLPLECKF